MDTARQNTHAEALEPGIRQPTPDGRTTSDCSARFPLQAYELRSSKAKTIPWKFAVEAYEEYAARYGRQQTLERLVERGGFGAEEIIMLLCQRIERIKKQNAEVSQPETKPQTKEDQ